jgi:hypothetical protein
MDRTRMINTSTVYLMIATVLSISLGTVSNTVQLIATASPESDSGSSSTEGLGGGESDQGEVQEPEEDSSGTALPVETPAAEQPAVEPEPKEPEAEAEPEGANDEATAAELPKCDGSFQDCVTDDGNTCKAGQGGHECECAEDMNDCPNHPSLKELPKCDGSFQDCVTDDGNTCKAGQGGHECECAEDMNDCPNHPSLRDPLPYCDLVDTNVQSCHDRYDYDEETGLYPCNDGSSSEDPLDCGDATAPPLDPEPSPSPSREPLPYCDIVAGPGFNGACHDRRDYDELTGLYPCNDGTQEVDWRDCADASAPEPGDNYCQALGCPGSPPDPENGCMDGRDPVNGLCPIPGPGNGNGNGDDDDDDNDNNGGSSSSSTVIIKNINNIQVIERTVKSDRSAVPNVDIIGLSVKDNGDAIVCLLNINNDWVECQEFGMVDDRADAAFDRIIEVDSTKEYDNGNTGSSTIDDAIDNIKSQDFNGLEDADNHSFNLDLAALGINDNGEGMICVIKDTSDASTKAFCEPFKIADNAVSGQITEIVEF